jgi:hypothetical protein
MFALVLAVFAANLAFVAVALGIGDFVLDRAERWTGVETGPASLERAGAALLVGLGACSYLGLALAVAHLFRVEAFGVCGALLVFLTRGRLIEYGRWACSGLARRMPPRPSVLVFGVAIAVIAAMQWLAALAPPEATDELAYHLPEARTLADGHVIRLMLGNDHIYGNFPALLEVLYGEALTVQGPALAHALHFTVVLGVLLVTAGLVRRLWGGRAAMLAVLGILLYSDLTYNATTAYVDAGATAFEVGAVLFVAAWLTDGQNGDAVAAALLAGLALSVKYTTGVSAGALALVVGVVLLRRRRLALLGKLVLLGLAACIYWYGKNLARFGNPVFPFALGHPGVSDSTYRYFVQTVHAYGDRSVAAFVRTPVLFANDGNLTAYLGFVLSPLALVARGPWKAAAGLLVYVIAYLAYWYWLESNQVRFLMPAVVTAIVLGAVAVGAARGAGGAIVVFSTAALLVVVAQLDTHGFSLHPGEAARSWLGTDKAEYALGLETRHAYLERYFGCQVDAVEALEARRLSGNVALWDLAPPPDYPRRNRLEPMKLTAATTAGAARQLRSRGIRFALAQGMPVRQLSANPTAWPILQRAVPFWRGGDCTLYRLRGVQNR